MAERLETQRRWPEAVSVWQEVVELAIRQIGEHSSAAQGFYLRFGMALFRAGDSARAAKVMYHSWRLLPRPLDFSDPHTNALFEGVSGLLLRGGFSAEAAQMLEEALPVLEQAFGKSPRTLLVRGNLGEMLRRTGDFGKSERYLREAIQQAELQGRDAEALASLHNNLGLLLRDTRRPSEGEVHCRDSVALCRATCNRTLLPVALDNQGSCLLDLGEYAKAEGLLTEAMALSTDVFPLDSEDVHLVRRHLVSATIKTGKMVEAKALLQEVLVGEAASRASLESMVLLCEVNLQMGELEAATEAVCKLAELLNRPEASLATACEFEAKVRKLCHASRLNPPLSVFDPKESFFDGLVRRYRASLNTMLFHFEAGQRRPLESPEPTDLRPRRSMLETLPGVKHFITEQSIRFAPFIAERDRPLAELFARVPASDVIATAWVHAILGEWNRALTVLEAATDQRTHDTALGLWLRGMFAKASILLAATRFEEALAVCELLFQQGEGSNPEACASILQLGSEVFDRLGNREKQFAALLAAYSCVRDSETADEWTKHYLELQVVPLLNPEARRELVSGKIRVIWEYLGLPLDNRITPNVYRVDKPDPLGFARLVLMVRHDIQLRTTEHINVDLMQRAAVAFESGLDFVNASRMWLSLAEDFLEGGNEMAFQGTLARAARLLQSLPGEWWFEVHRLEARYAAIHGDRATAIRSLFQALEASEQVRTSLSLPEERRNYFARLADASRTLVVLLLDEGRENEAWMVSERVNARSLLDQVVNRGAPSANNRPDATGRGLIDLDRIQREIRESEALVAPILVGDGVTAFVVRRGKLSVHRWKADSTTIATRVAELKSLLQPCLRPPPDAEERTLACARELHDLLLAPLAAALCGVRNLIWIPEYALNSLPVDCLHDGTQFLVEKYSFVTCFSAAVYSRLASLAKGELPRRRFARALVLGDSCGDLPGALQECQWVAKALERHGGNVVLLVGADATWEKVEGEVERTSLWHVACHGFFNPVFPERSYVRLFSPTRSPDANLTMDRLAQLRLPGSLVVMTSCHTGAARVQFGNEMSGFVRKLIEANARAVIAPLWQLGDEVAHELMKEFYPRALGGTRPDVALQAAKIQLLRNPRFASPQHWSPIQMFGVSKE
jgi:CHAT domain-containing protein/Tfp pilus assembly protein PilF